jgi:hypothetical protein
VRLSYSPPKRSFGPRAKANQKARRETWPAILRRANYRCEMCQAREQLFWCHIFGRPGSGLCLGPWANAEALTAALCARCHDVLDRRGPSTVDDRERVRLLLFTAMGRLVEHLPRGQEAPWVSGEDVVSAIREIVRRLEALGITPDPSRELDRK